MKLELKSTISKNKNEAKKMTFTFNLYIYVYARTSLFFVFTLLSSKHVKVLLRLWFVCITLVEPNSNT